VNDVAGKTEVEDEVLDEPEGETGEKV